MKSWWLAHIALVLIFAGSSLPRCSTHRYMLSERIKFDTNNGYYPALYTKGSRQQRSTTYDHYYTRPLNSAEMQDAAAIEMLRRVSV